MIFAFDFDGTWTRDPEGMAALVRLLQARGHTCILLTGRSDEDRWGAEVRRAIGNLMPIVFAANNWKRDAAKAAGYAVDVFVDDLPEYVAPQDPRRTVGRRQVVPDGWTPISPRVSLRFERGELAEIAATVRQDEEVAPLVAEVIAHLGYEVEVWGRWCPHPETGRHHANARRVPCPR